MVQFWTGLILHLDLLIAFKLVEMITHYSVQAKSLWSIVHGVNLKCNHKGSETSKTFTFTKSAYLKLIFVMVVTSKSIKAISFFKNIEDSEIEINTRKEFKTVPFLPYVRIRMHNLNTSLVS